MATYNNGTAVSIATLISNAAQFNPVSDTDIKRWFIIQLNNTLAGLPANGSPTLQQIETAAAQLGQVESPKILDAILFTLVINALGAGPGVGVNIYGTGAPNNNQAAYGNPGDLYVDTAATGGTQKIYSKATGTGTNTGWL
jgi:hypothetical protein